MQAQPERRGRSRARRFATRLLGCAYVATIVLGFMAGLASQIHSAEEATYNPTAFAIGAAGLFAAACTVIAFQIWRNRGHVAKVRALEDQCEALSDRNWELKEACERARSFLEVQGDVIVRRDTDGRITYANDAFCALTGHARAALVGTFYAPEVLEQGDTALLPDGTRVHDQKIATSTGERWLAWREVAVRGLSGAEIQSVGRDVTDRTLAEQALGEARDQAEAASRAKSRFLAMVSHEIRTPLNGMLGMADLLLDTQLTPEQVTYAKAAKASGETLLSLIEEILDFSKIEAGKLDLEARPFRLATLVEEAVELLAPRAQAKGLEIASFVDERLPERVIGDVARLRQVLLNLAGNAIKFTDKGGVSVVVEPGIWSGEVAFQVRDTGIGIAPDQRSRIFEEFEQADGSPTRKFGGTGLGLAISKRIVEGMGGRIGVESQPGAGSTFEFSVKLPAAEATADQQFTAPDLSGKAVLIVAPGAIEASLLARRLARWGAKTCAVPDADVAAAILPERRYDILLADQALGGAAIAALGRLTEGAIPQRVLLTTPGERHALAGLKQNGFSGYLVKPVRAASLARLSSAQMDVAPAESDDVARRERDGRQAGLSILVAEDNEINALLVRSLLSKLGHHPTIATGGAAAIESWLAARTAGAPYDLIVMDVQMPDLDGIEATRRIRAAEAQSGETRTRIIALTANAFDEDREACLAAGMDGFLLKPLDREQLAAVIETPTSLAA